MSTSCTMNSRHPEPIRQSTRWWMNPFHLFLVYDDQSLAGPMMATARGRTLWWLQPLPRTCWWSRAIVNMTPMIKHSFKVFVHNKEHELVHEGIAPQTWVDCHDNTRPMVANAEVDWQTPYGGAGQQQKSYGGKCCNHPATL